MSHYFPKLLSFQAHFGNFGSRLMKFGLYFRANLRKFWKYDPCLYQFLHWIRGHRYTRRLILRPISAARPRIDLCTKNPPEPEGMTHSPKSARMFYFVHKWTWCFWRRVTEVRFKKSVKSHSLGPVGSLLWGPAPPWSQLQVWWPTILRKIKNRLLLWYAFGNNFC